MSQISPRLQEAIDALATGELVPGSSAIPGTLYNPLPFEELRGQKVHRQAGSIQRWNLIRDSVETFGDKSVIDFGAASGYFTFKAAQAGASMVNAFDHDQKNIDVIREASSWARLPISPKCYRDTYLIEELKYLAPWDIGFCLSVLMWLGHERANNMIRWLSERVDVLFVDIALRGDASSGADWLTSDRELIDWIKAESEYVADVRKIGASMGMGGRDRALIRCSTRKPIHDLWREDGAQAQIHTGEYLLNRHYATGAFFWIPKAIRGSNANPKPLQGWRLCKQRLQDSPHAPRIYEIGLLEDGREFVAMEYVKGDHISEWDQTQADAILRELFGADLLHRDLRPENIIKRRDGTWCMIDFGWACDKRTPYPAPADTEMFVRPPSAKNDADALDQLRERLQ